MTNKDLLIELYDMACRGGQAAGCCNDCSECAALWDYKHILKDIEFIEAVKDKMKKSEAVKGWFNTVFRDSQHKTLVRKWFNDKGDK